MTDGVATRVGRLAIRLPNWLGDALMALRAFDAVYAAANASGRPLVAVARPAVRSLLEPRHPGVEWLPAPASGPGGFVPAIGPLARARTETIILCPPSASARLHAFLAGVPQRVGLAGESFDRLLTRRAPRAPRGSRHLEDEYLDLAKLAGASPVPRTTLVPSTRVEAHASSLVLAPGARYGPAKRWPAARFAAVADCWLAAAAGRHVVLVGGAEDRDAGDAVRAGIGAGEDRVIDRVGKTNLPELHALVAGAGAVVSNDSGVAHLAAASGTPTVAIFGSTDPGWTAPRGPRVTVLADPPPCSPCFRRTCRVAERYRCLRAIGADRVTRALDDLLAPPPG